MSTFEVKVVKIDSIEEIPGADAIELARIADYRSVIRKGDYKAGDLAVYIPEASVIPECVLKVMGLEGKLAGSGKNRVKAIKLRGCLSQGILYHVDHNNDGQHYISAPSAVENGAWDFEDGVGYMLNVKEGDNIAEQLGIKKYEPTIPTCMAGEVCNLGMEHVLKYDIENLKKYPNIFEEGEEVSVTEKLHGTFCQIGYVPDIQHKDLFQNGDIFVCSKGLGAQGLVFKNNEKNVGNVYVKTLHNLLTVANITEVFLSQNDNMYIMGEIYGKGVQDLTYGLETPQFRVFDIYFGKPGLGRFLNPDEMRIMAKKFNLQTVTELYAGPYDRVKIDSLANGKTITGNGTNVLEGVVIKPIHERRNDDIGRVFLKHISEQYLLRKNENATEFN